MLARLRGPVTKAAAVASAAYAAQRYLPSATELVQHILAESIFKSIPNRLDAYYAVKNLCIPAMQKELAEFIDTHVGVAALKETLHEEARELFTKVHILLDKSPPSASPSATLSEPMQGPAFLLGSAARGSVNRVTTGNSIKGFIGQSYCKPFILQTIKHIAMSIKEKVPGTEASMNSFIYGIDKPGMLRPPEPAVPELRGGRLTRRRRKAIRPKYTRRRGC